MLSKTYVTAKIVEKHKIGVKQYLSCNKIEV